jgi:hypothetical protein
MQINKLKETIREVIEKVLAEGPAAAPAPSKPGTAPTVAPGKPGTDKPKPRRPLGNPDVKPKPKASMNEDEMVDKIVKRFQAKKVNEVYNEGSNKEIEDIKQRRDSVDSHRANAYRQYMQVKRNLENPKDLEQIEKEWNAINSKLKKKSDDLSKQIRNRPKNKSFFGNDTESGEDKGWND